jgi:ubiquitin-conjugating enzyme E2 W
MGAKVRAAYLLLSTLLLTQGILAEQASSPHSQPTSLSTVTRQTPPIGRLPSSLNHRQNVFDESFDREEFNNVVHICKIRCLDVRGCDLIQKSFANSALSIRGGGSSEQNTVQTIVKSILSSPALPVPIKSFIAMVCQLLESVTGFHILPPVEQKTKAMKSKPKQKEVLVEEVYVGSAKKKRTKKKNVTESDVVVFSSASVSEDEKLVDKTLVKRKKKKTKTASSDSEIAKKDEEAPATEEVEAPQQPKPTVTSTKSKQPEKTDAASKKFLSNNLKSSNPNYRIQRELKEFLKSPPPGLSVKISGKNVRLWVITLSMPDNSIYAGDKYKLRVQFPNDYPTSPPSVYFLPPTPRHEHVYTNGDICLSLLGKDWRPIMTAQSIAQAIFSILCGAQRKSLPMDNARHAGNKPGQKQDDWVYHDDNC